MAVNIKEVCSILDKHAKTVCPSIDMFFLPHAGCPLTLVAYVTSETRIAFGAKEVIDATDQHELSQLFKPRLNEALAKVAEKAINSKIR